MGARVSSGTRRTFCAERMFSNFFTICATLMLRSM